MTRRPAVGLDLLGMPTHPSRLIRCAAGYAFRVGSKNRAGSNWAGFIPMPRLFPLKPFRDSRGVSTKNHAVKELVLEPRIPILSASLGGKIKHVPKRPDHVDVAAVLARFLRRKQEFGVVEVMDLAISVHEYVE